jgi:ketosteroid isomerase-like protein
MATRLRDVSQGILFLAFCSCSGSTPEEGIPGVTESTDPSEVIEAHEGLVRALEAGDVEVLASILDRSPEFLIFHANLASRIDDVDEAMRGFEKMSRSLGTTEWTEVHAMVSRHGDLAWLTSHLLLEAPALDEPFVGRATEIWIRRADGWKLVHGHWSDEGAGP